jgi:hypothetical protein
MIAGYTAELGLERQVWQRTEWSNSRAEWNCIESKYLCKYLFHLFLQRWNVAPALSCGCSEGATIAGVAEAYGTFEVKWSVRVVAERGTNEAKPDNVMERKKGHVPQANDK